MNDVTSLELQFLKLTFM